MKRRQFAVAKFCFLCSFLNGFGDNGVIQKLQKLSEFLKFYSCLFNKKEQGFVKEEKKQRAWNEIVKKLDLGDVSRAAAGTINKAQKDLEGLTYLNWLFTFVKVRSAKSNLATYKETGKTSLDDDVQKNVDQNDENENEDDTNRQLDDLTEELITKTIVANSVKISVSLQ